MKKFALFSLLAFVVAGVINVTLTLVFDWPGAVAFLVGVCLGSIGELVAVALAEDYPR